MKEYKNSFASKPWAHPKSITGLASEGYAFGSEDGQIKHISDHNHILPLYDYGLDVYDFDMKKVQPIADLAKMMARVDVLKYFNTP